MNTRTSVCLAVFCLLFTLAIGACKDDSSATDTGDQGTPSNASTDGAAEPADQGTPSDASTDGAAEPALDAAGDATPDMPPATGSATIGAEGGAFSSMDGVVALTIPAGVVSDPTEFRIDPVEDASDLPTGHTGPAYHLQPEGVVFASPVVLTLDWSALGISEEEGSVLRLATVMEGQWVTVAAGWNDLGTQMLTAHIPHFSYWAALPAPGAKRGFNPCVCPTLEALQQCASEVPVLRFACGSSIGAWAWRHNNADCGLGGHNQTDWYSVYDCIEEFTASHNPFNDTPTALHTYGGCTKAERDCCEEANGMLGWSDEACFCAPPSDGEAHPELAACLAKTEECGGDQTSCERYRSGSNPDSCGASCVDLWSDPEHCGGCGNVCESDTLCIDGVCSDLCNEQEPWLIPCQGTCVDLLFNRQNCGQCAWTCASDEACEDGECVPDDYKCEDGPRPCSMGANGLFCCGFSECWGGVFHPYLLPEDPPAEYPGPDHDVSCSCVGASMFGAEQEGVWTCTVSYHD